MEYVIISCMQNQLDFLGEVDIVAPFSPPGCWQQVFVLIKLSYYSGERDWEFKCVHLLDNSLRHVMLNNVLESNED